MIGDSISRLLLFGTILFLTPDSGLSAQAVSVSECEQFKNNLGAPLILQSRLVSGKALGGTPQASKGRATSAYKIGIFKYYGGVREYVSSDPRFDGVLISKLHGPYHRCGHGFEVVYGPAPQAPLSRAHIRFNPTAGLRAPLPGSTAAGRAGAIPVVRGYAAGASWPISGPRGYEAFLGLMHPQDGRNETLIVRFEKPEARAPTTVLARLPMQFQYITTLPRLHEAGTVATLVGKAGGGPYRQIALEMPDDPDRTPKSAIICSSLPNVGHLQDLDCSEATALIGQLKDVQRSLKAGGRLTFHLLSGAPASDPMTKISPREAFLRMPFEKAFIVDRVKTDNRLWRPYKIAIKPVGTGRFIWRVEVVRGFSDNLERVEMFYGPPPPA